jgi:hypothetical protein
MIIRKKKPFSVGAIFAISFAGILLLIFSPVFGGKNGLQFSDDSFNKLAKGSSYFIPKVSKEVEKTVGKPMTATVKLEDKEQVDNTAKLFTTAGAKVEVKDGVLLISGDMGTVLKSALQDADSMYNNDGKTITARYGYDEKQVMKNWWFALGKFEKGLKKDKQVEDANLVGEVNKKGIEPAYNFYKIDANKVSEHAGMLSGLLVFYVLYTMWWGFAIFYLFEGIGLTMKKSKVKKEA